MTRSRVAHIPFVRPRTTPTFLLTLFGLAAVIIGILAMHVWMGGHGSTFHHVAGPAATGSAVPVGHSAPSGHPDAVVDAVIPAMDAVSAMSPAPLDHGLVAACGADCTVEMALGACMLVMIIVSLAGSLTPAGRASASALVRRGPPVVHRPSRPAPAPSLIRLCISRI